MKIEQVGTLEAKTRLSELLDQVERGKRFQITRHGKPIAELAPPSKKKTKRKFGCGKGLITYISPDFDAPLDDFKEYME
ncbi:MAG TPA: type II toxin-antitoxin system Phd/YefM family antitoxin [Verrucomicrobiae bacterium]|jgi:prevent-host-death family protein|nr:type II toxin-antitoxin system Phd/YefM family antitoxin [Verrucomicrobiae bacterium]